MSGKHHIISLGTYRKILMALLVLTVVTVGVAKPVTGVDFGLFNTFVAMLIASIKAYLVLSIFMHLKYDNKVNAGIFVTSVFFLIVMFLFSYFDILTRISVNSTL